MDYSEVAIDYCKKIFDGELIQGDLNQPIKFESSYDAILALDVLEHLKDDVQGIRNISDALAPGGCAIIAVPAHPILWAINDINSMHYRRYTKKTFMELCQKSGLTIRYFSYYNCWLFPPVAIIRLLQRLFHYTCAPDEQLESKIPPRLINSLLFKIFSAEKRPLTKGRRLPWGLSLLAVLEKKPSTVMNPD